MKHIGGVIYYVGVIMTAALTYAYCALAYVVLRATSVMAFLLGYDAGKNETGDFLFSLPCLKKLPKHAKEYYKEYHE